MSSGFDNGALNTNHTAYGVICGPTSAPGTFQSANVGTSGQVLTSNGASSPPSMQTFGLGFPTTVGQFFYYDDFSMDMSDSLYLDVNTFQNTTSVSNHPGIFQTFSILGDTYMYTGSNWTVADGEFTFSAWVTVSGTIPSATGWEIFIGTGANVTDPTGNDSIGFLFDPDDSTTNWILFSDNAGTRTKTDSGTAVTNGGTWQELKFVINEAGTSIEYFIDGASEGTVTTNIPSAAMNPIKMSFDNPTLESANLQVDAVQVGISFGSGDRS